jgi:hypothetical protein
MANPKIHNNTNNYYGKPKDPQNYKMIIEENICLLIE